MYRTWKGLVILDSTQPSGTRTVFFLIRRIIEPKREKVTRDLRELLNEELENFFFQWLDSPLGA
jgi:hypothetical protein